MVDIHIHVTEDGSSVNVPGSRRSTTKKTTKSDRKPKRKNPGAGLPKKFAKMGFKKGWAAYKRTPGWKAKQKSKAKKGRR